MNCFNFLRNLFFSLIVTLALSACGDGFHDALAKRYADARVLCSWGALVACRDADQLEREIYSMSGKDQAAIMASAQKYMERKVDELFGRLDGSKKHSKNTEENTEAEQDYSRSQEALLNRIQVNSNKVVQPTPQDSIQNTNKIVENCLDKLTLTYEGQNKKLINALAEKDAGLHAAKVDYMRGGPDEYTAKMNSEFLKSFANMNSSLKNICDNTKIEVNVSFN